MENAAISDCILRNSCANCDVIAKTFLHNAIKLHNVAHSTIATVLF